MIQKIMMNYKNLTYCTTLDTKCVLNFELNLNFRYNLCVHVEHVCVCIYICVCVDNNALEMYVGMWFYGNLIAKRKILQPNTIYSNNIKVMLILVIKFY